MGMVAMLHGVKPKFLEECLTNDETVHTLEADFSGQDPDCLDLDKSWGGLTYLLGGNETGFSSDELTSQAITNKQVINEEDILGYTPAFYLTCEQVAQIANALGELSHDTLKSRYHPNAMTDIYPCGWNDNDIEYLLGYFDELRQFYQTQSQKGHAIISYIF